MKLNKEELLVGFIYGSCPWPLIGWIAIVPGIICAFFWAFGGSGPKLVRRIGVPVAVAIALAFRSAWLLLTFPFLFGIVAIGYGMPCENDKGSMLARFYNRYLTYDAANFATRFSIFALFNIVIIISLAILRR